jgi:hypothetical protein
MSVKAMSLVWDVQCPSKINDFDFKPGHKYVLIAYADHADQQGRNIYPAVLTIAGKTGYEERSVQRLTRELVEMGLLVEDGTGPRGTNRWLIPFSAGGDKIAPLTNYQGDISSKSLGDIPSGDIPSGDILTPELKKQNLINISLYNKRDSVWGDIKAALEQEFPKAQFQTWIDPAVAVDFDGRLLTIGARNNYAMEWLEDKVKDRAQSISGYYVEFVVHAVMEMVEAET